jgi:fatty acid desaturase
MPIITLMEQAELESYRARQGEIDAYRARTRSLRAVIWWAGLLASVGSGLAVGSLWSFRAGIPLACGLGLLWLPTFLRLDRAMQIRRFPELGGENARWRRRYFL